MREPESCVRVPVRYDTVARNTADQASDDQRMNSFLRYYRSIFHAFGCPLSTRAAVPQRTIAIAEKRLSAKIPAALRHYLLVAGRERRLNRCHNRLLPLEDWTMDRQRLIFMEENQRVVVWGVSVRNPAANDPPVWQAVSEEPLTWYREHRRLSEFLAVMLHVQAVSGGLRHCAQATVPKPFGYRFRNHGWTCYGTVNGLTAYSRREQVVCILTPGDRSFLPETTVLAGTKSKAGLRMLQDEMEIEFE